MSIFSREKIECNGENDIPFNISILLNGYLRDGDDGYANGIFQLLNEWSYNHFPTAERSGGVLAGCPRTKISRKNNQIYCRGLTKVYAKLDESAKELFPDLGREGVREYFRDKVLTGSVEEKQKIRDFISATVIRFNS